MNGLLLNVGVVFLFAVFVNIFMALLRYQTLKSIKTISGNDPDSTQRKTVNKTYSLVVRWTWTIAIITIIWFILFGNAWKTMIVPSKSVGIQPVSVKEDVLSLKDSAAQINQSFQDEKTRKKEQATKDNTDAMNASIEFSKKTAEDAKNKKGQ